MRDEITGARSFMPLLRRLLAPLLALLLPACATVDAPPVNAAEAARGPAIWKVADKDTTIYLFGTIHALPEGKSWFNGPVERAYDSSQEVVTEYLAKDNVGEEIARRGLLTGPATLRSLMKPADRMHLEETLVSFGVPVEALDKYKPWFAALVLTKMQAEKAGFDQQSGADRPRSRTLRVHERRHRQRTPLRAPVEESVEDLVATHLSAPPTSEPVPVGGSVRLPRGERGGA